MKLSEAIRLGSMLKPQAFGDFTDGVGTCAWGAAHEAVGLSHDSALSETPEWDALCERAGRVRCPECRSRRVLHMLILHLNDDHFWPREQIADFVEQIEAQQDAAQPDPVPATVTA